MASNLIANYVIWVSFQVSDLQPQQQELQKEQQRSHGSKRHEQQAKAKGKTQHRCSKLKPVQTGALWKDNPMCDTLSHMNDKETGWWICDPGPNVYLSICKACIKEHLPTADKDSTFKVKHSYYRVEPQTFNLQPAPGCQKLFLRYCILNQLESWLGIALGVWGE